MSTGTAGIKTLYFRYDRQLLPDAERSDVVCYDGTRSLSPAHGTVLPATIVEPYFERSWERFCGHFQTPPATATPHGCATVSTSGAAIAFDIFKAFAEHGQTHMRALFAFVMNRLLPEPLIKSDMPSHVELTVTSQRNRAIVHVLSYAPQRRTPKLDIVEEATPVVNRRISLRLQHAPKSAHRQPGGETMEFKYSDGYATVSLTSDAGHDLIVFE